MKNISLLLLLSLFYISGFSQINMADSSVQVIGYWDLNEKHSYQIIQEKYKIEKNDTTDRESTKYKVDITIKDSTANSYTIDWFYHDYDIQSNNELLQKFATLTQDMIVTIKTDELGALQSIENWQDISKFIKKALKKLKKETKDIPNMDTYIKQIMQQYDSKEEIELAAIAEIRLFHTFHGAKYLLEDEIRANVKTPNLHGGEAFDTQVTLWVDEINPNDNDFIIRMHQSVDSMQLTKSTYDYLKNMSNTLEIQGIDIKDFPTCTNDIYTASLLHGTGWVLYAIETKEVEADHIISISELTIDFIE